MRRAVATPHFVWHFMHCCRQEPRVLHWCQSLPFPELVWPAPLSWSTAQGDPLPEQRSIVDELMNCQQGVAVVMASRGREKSALAGMLVRQWPGRVLVTAPAKAATEVLAQHAAERFAFYAPCSDNGVVSAEREWL